MKTRRLTAILTSAYVSAMLASSVAPIRSDATLAATIDPMAAQKALENAVSGLDATGWLAAVAASPAVAQPAPRVVANNPAPKADPVMTLELMERLIKLARNQTEYGSLNARMCKVLDLCDGTKNMPAWVAESDSTDGEHYFLVPLNADSKDIIFAVKRATALEAYLTDKTGKLRAAAVLDDDGARLITNEKAAAKFKAELSLFAGEAADLPPTRTPVPGNS